MEHNEKLKNETPAVSLVRWLQQRLIDLEEELPIDPS